MAEWRFGRGWSEAELERRVAVLRTSRLNFGGDALGQPLGGDWRRYFTEAVVGREGTGKETSGATQLEKAWAALQAYQFSDPSIVTAHFDPSENFLGRTLLLEIHAVGLHYLCGTRVTQLKVLDAKERSYRGFRYDTLEGHFETGSEWFLLTLDHQSGEITFRIEASWKPGVFPNFWSRVGFAVMGEHYQLAWHRLAYQRMRTLLGSSGARFAPIPRGRRLVHAGATLQDPELWALRGAAKSENS